MRAQLKSRPRRRLHRPLFVATLAGIAACHGSSGGGPAPPAPSSPGGGLDSRPVNATCIAPPRQSAGSGVSITLQREFQNLSFSQPLAMLQASGDATRWFVAEKTGRVRVFADDPNVASFASDFIDLTSFVNLNANSEGGLLGLAFHPNFASNGFAYLSWTEGDPMVSVIARFTSLDGGQTLDPSTQQDILRLNQDFTNHNGGQIAFGPDGYLYAGFGDGGSGGDPLGRAQDTTNLLGAMLRLDVDGATPYAIPPTNPFAGNPGCPADPDASATSCPEIFAWGLRNPWRWSFDSATGELWLGDVGQSTWEEVDRIELGGNYGWDCREGDASYGSPAPSCSTAAGLIDPLHTYPRTDGISITGGFVYRGTDVPALVGDYLFADYGSGRIWRLVDDGAGSFTAEELLDTALSIASFGQRSDGELYIVDIAGGLQRIVAGTSAPPGSPPVPQQLSATGCVDAQNPAAPAAGLIPYDVAAGFWSDGATKSRWLALPNGTTIAVNTDGDFTFPPGTVLVKRFTLGSRLVETRLLMRHPNGEWAGYTYEWNAQQTDATLVTGGKVSSVAGQNWIFPSENDCLGCHTSAAGVSLGPETAQLNNAIAYPSTGRSANQLTTLDAIALFPTTIGDPTVLPALADPTDPTRALNERARAYLHTNCAQCHRPGGPTPSSLDFRYATALAQTGACDAPPQAGDLGLGSTSRIVRPGDPDMSVLAARMDRRDANGMPPLGSNLIDTDGVMLIRDWIASLSSCQ